MEPAFVLDNTIPFEFSRFFFNSTFHFRSNRKHACVKSRRVQVNSRVHLYCLITYANVTLSAIRVKFNLSKKKNVFFFIWLRAWKLRTQYNSLETYTKWLSHGHTFMAGTSHQISIWHSLTHRALCCVCIAAFFFVFLFFSLIFIANYVLLFLFKVNKLIKDKSEQKKNALTSTRRPRRELVNERARESRNVRVWECCRRFFNATLIYWLF